MKRDQGMYDNERINQILKEFQDALVIADNFSEPKKINNKRI